jgi:hypothetical protein
VGSQGMGICKARPELRVGPSVSQAQVRIHAIGCFRLRVITCDRSRMRESRSYGSVRGAPSNGRPYRETVTDRSWPFCDLPGRVEIREKAVIACQIES